MKEIIQLSKETIDKIAAGEVVERPASVVKELVENAVDAGATAVTVEIREGGIELIRVTDNGEGISPDQVRQAFLRHATSKIREVEDLLSIASFGFRGEALSSISAVSKVELITKTPGALLGIRYQIEGGQEKSMEEIGAPEGSTFLIRTLFYNTPARKKFLKSPVTEAGYISDMMEHLALSHPDVSFKFISNGQVRLHTSGNHRLKDLIYSIYGREIAQNLLEVDRSRDGIHISGYIGKPVISRGNRNYENYYVNGRFVRSSVLAKAIEEGYQAHLMQHRYPFTVLQISIDGNLVDVNVHPAKMEIRFADNAQVYQLLFEMIRDALSHRELIPDAAAQADSELRREQAAERAKQRKDGAAMPEPFEKMRRSFFADPSSPYQRRYPDRNSYSGGASGAAAAQDTVRKPAPAMFGPYGASSPESLPAQPVSRERVQPAPGVTVQPVPGETVQPGQEKSAQLLPKEPAQTEFVQSRMSRPEAVASTHSEQEPETFSAENGSEDRIARTGLSEEENPKTELFSQETSLQQNAVPDGIAQGPAASETGTPGAAGQAQEEGGSAAEMPSGTARQESLFDDDRLLSEKNVAEHRVIGQVFDTYWLVQFRDHLFLIDQHAAHEKVLYERLCRQIEEGTVASQQISPPLILSLSLQEENLLQKYLSDFEKAGFEISHFGGREYAISGEPASLYGMTDRELFTQMLDSLGEAGGAPNARTVYEKLAGMACKAAVKGNHRLSGQEAEALIGELLTLDNPYNCPHGRPTIISFSKRDLEKKFKRIV